MCLIFRTLIRRQLETDSAPSVGGQLSLAQQLANHFNIPFTGFTTGLGFSGTSNYIHGHKALPSATGPLYLVTANGSQQQTFSPLAPGAQTQQQYVPSPLPINIQIQLC